MKQTFHLSFIMKIKNQLSDFRWFVCVPRSLSAAALRITCIVCGLITWPSFLSVTALKAVCCPWGFFLQIFKRYSRRHQHLSVWLRNWYKAEWEEWLSCADFALLKGECYPHANNCLHFSLNFVNKAGVKCLAFTSTASNILGNICNLESSKLCCSAEVVSFKCTDTLVSKLRLGMHQ